RAATTRAPIATGWGRSSTRAGTSGASRRPSVSGPVRGRVQGRMTIEVRAHRSIREIPEATWDALDGGDEAPFLRWAWFEALELTSCVGVDAGWLPHHLSLWEKGQLVGAVPAYLKDNSEGEFVFDWAWAAAAERAGLAYYPKLVVAVPFTPATAARLLVADR